MMHYSNTKFKVHSPYRDKDSFDFVAGVLQWGTDAPYLFIIFLDYVLRTVEDVIKENGFIQKKKRKKLGTDDIPQKLLRTQTMQPFSQIHQSKPNLWCID